MSTHVTESAEYYILNYFTRYIIIQTSFIYLQYRLSTFILVRAPLDQELFMETLERRQ